MATQLFLLNTGADTHLGTNNAKRNGSASAWNPKALGTARGPGVVASATIATVTGPTDGIEICPVTTTPGEWISPPVSADVTISGTITANIWAAENDVTANVAINVIIDIIRANSFAVDGSNEIVNIVQSTNTTEVALTTRTANNFTSGMTSYSAQTLNRGDRLRIRIVGDDAGTMATGFLFIASWAGTSGGADGDTYVTFTENFSFESAPAGTRVYLTSANSGISVLDAFTLISDFSGTDEDPLSEGGNWAQLDTSAFPLKRVSNTVIANNVDGGQSYWTPTDFGDDFEAYISPGTGTQLRGIVLRIQEAGGAGTWDGYYVSTSNTTLFHYRVSNGVLSLMFAFAHGLTLGSGDRLGVKCIGDTIQSWISQAGAWRLFSSLSDTTHPNTGDVGLATGTDSSAFIEDFYLSEGIRILTQSAWTSRGTSAHEIASMPATGWVAPRMTHEWYTPPLSAFTLSGMALANIRARETSSSANASLRCEIARVESDGSSPTIWGSWCMNADNARTGELGTTEAAESIYVSGDDLPISPGQRLRVRLYSDDSPGAALSATGTIRTFYNGATDGASGDSYIVLPQTISTRPPGYQRLYGPALLGTSPTDLYVVPGGEHVRLRHIFANNPTGSPVDFTFSIGDDAAALRLYDSYNVPAGGSLEWAYDHALVAGEKIQAYAGTSSALVLTVDAYVQPQ